MMRTYFFCNLNKAVIHVLQTDPHTSIQYVNKGYRKEQYSVIQHVLLRYFLALLRIPIDLAIFNIIYVEIPV